ncbi:MAG: hypothetical protein DSZ24_06115 [Thermodesulfatator sp.]|nr:MAG: hypothetical protein DSZ24_06115 [Thermodesulfatator sp.]
MKWSKEAWRKVAVVEHRILRALEEGPKSVPELAEALKLSPEEVLLAVSGLLRSKKIEPQPKSRRERFFRYGLKETSEKVRGLEK